jgi:hypothetical protein
MEDQVTERDGNAVLVNERHNENTFLCHEKAMLLAVIVGSLCACYSPPICDHNLLSMITILRLLNDVVPTTRVTLNVK